MKTFLTAVLLVIALAVKGYRYFTNSKSSSQSGGSSNQEITKNPQSGDDPLQNGYAVLKNCTYVPDAKYNDGDSFKVKTADGRVFELRMYFVDTAESKDKPYDDYRERVADQGKDFGGLDYQQTIKLGREAKKLAESMLKKEKFTVFTKWERVHGGDRYYCFLQMEDGKWWDEILIGHGLARIHTKGADTPGGSEWRAYKKQLWRIEQDAKRRRVGAWGM